MLPFTAFDSSGEARLCLWIAFCEFCLSGLEMESGTLELAPSLFFSALLEEPAPLSREDVVEYLLELFCEAKMLCTLFKYSWNIYRQSESVLEDLESS